VSFGIAGGLAPDLEAGTVIVGERVLTPGDEPLALGALPGPLPAGWRAGAVLSAGTPLATVADKAAAWEATGALAVDVESRSVAEVAQARGLGVVVVRVVADGAHDPLPPAALEAPRADGGIDGLAVLRSLIGAPGQIPGLLRLARRTARARAVLGGVASHLLRLAR